MPREKIFIIIWFVAVALLSFFVGSSIKQANQAGYPKGTIIETYKSLPAEFPSDILAERYLLKDAAVVKYPGGGVDISLSYVSPQSLVSSLVLYSNHLKEIGWSIKTQKLLPDSGIISVAKDNAEMNITFIPKSNGTELSFSYKKTK